MNSDEFKSTVEERLWKLVTDAQEIMEDEHVQDYLNRIKGSSESGDPSLPPQAVEQAVQGIIKTVPSSFLTLSGEKYQTKLKPPEERKEEHELDVPDGYRPIIRVGFDSCGPIAVLNSIHLHDFEKIWELTKNLREKTDQSRLGNKRKRRARELYNSKRFIRDYERAAQEYIMNKAGPEAVHNPGGLALIVNEISKVKEFPQLKEEAVQVKDGQLFLYGTPCHKAEQTYVLNLSGQGEGLKDRIDEVRGKFPIIKQNGRYHLVGISEYGEEDSIFGSGKLPAVGEQKRMDERHSRISPIDTQYFKPVTGIVEFYAFIPEKSLPERFRES